MKAVRLFEFDRPPRVEEVPEPRITGPLDVIVRIAGAGVCRTDLHLVEGIFKEGMADKMPFTLGHENAGWIEEVGSGVPDLVRGDPVILHPQPSCGLCRNCRIGNDMHCTGGSFFPGFDGTDGGYAEYLKTNVRAVIKLAPGTDPGSLAPFADAGITAYHAVKKLLQEARMPPWERENLPLIWSGDELVAVPGIGVALAFQAGPEEAGWRVEWRPSPTVSS